MSFLIHICCKKSALLPQLSARGKIVDAGVLVRELSAAVRVFVGMMHGFFHGHEGCVTYGVELSSDLT